MQQLTREQFLNNFKKSLEGFEDAVSTNIRYAWLDEPSKFSQDLTEDDWIASLIDFHRHKTLD